MEIVSIIVVNYNGRHLLESCLGSLYRQVWKDIEIILVDNASHDGSLEYVSEAFPGIKSIPLPSNIGFAGANNEGLKEASGRYLMLLNNDVELDKECVSNLCRAAEKDPRIGICAAKMLVAGKGVIDSAGDGFSTALRGFKRGEGLSSDLFNREEFVFGACAGAALYRREMIEDIGFLDEDFFLIHEDTDLNFRAQLAGWKAVYVPSAIAFHKVRSTIKPLSDLAVFYSLRNAELLRIKDVPPALLLRCLPSYAITALLEFLYFAGKHGKISLYIRAKREALRLLPQMMRKRRTVMGKKRVDSRQIRRLMTPLLQREFFASKARKFFAG